jgi:hypothetical protein
MQSVLLTDNQEPLQPKNFTVRKLTQGASRVRSAKEQGDQKAGPSKPTNTGEKPSWLWVCTDLEMADKQANDPDIGPIYKAKQIGCKPSPQEMEVKSPASRHYWLLWDNLILKNGVLLKCLNCQSTDGGNHQLMVPVSLQHELIGQMHCSLTAGHLGIKKTKSKLVQRYYWYNLKEDIKLYIAQCDVCAADKPAPKTARAPMGHLRSGAPWDTLGIDYLGPFPKSPRGNKYIMVLTDHFSKYVEVIPVPNQHAEECATRIVNDVIARWGAPLNIHTDQGSTFESKVFRKLCSILEVRKSRCSPRNPKGNGVTERFNRTLLQMIKAYLTNEQENWDEHLGCLAGAYRATPHEATRLSPNLMTIGREIRLPADLVYHSPGTSEDEPLSSADHVLTLKNRMLHAHTLARKYLGESAQRSKARYDVKSTLNSYAPGDLVWMLHETRKIGVTPKLEKRFVGPYMVTEKRSIMNYVIRLDATGTEKLVHHDKLKLYTGLNVPAWVKKARRTIQYKD